MNRISRKKKNRTLLLSFAIPCVGMLALMIICGYEPFGDSAVLYSDNYHQYWSWDVGLGMDYLGLISYYLASPLYLLSVLVPEMWVLEYYCLLLPIRLGLAGLFFAIFLKYTFGKRTCPWRCFLLFMLCAPGRWAISGTSCGSIPSP